MTRRKVIFYSSLENKYFVSEEYNGDKTEMEQFGGGACDHTWPELMSLLDDVTNIPRFLKALSQIAASYHPVVNGVPLPEQANGLPGARLSVAHTVQELEDMVGTEDEVWIVKRGTPGVSKLELWEGQVVLDEDMFRYDAAPGTLVSQGVVDDAMDCLPPACYCSECSQMGEPYSMKLDDKLGKYRNTYATFRKVGGTWPDSVWEYCGHCFRGEVKERGVEMPRV